MPKAGDLYRVDLRANHLSWGTYRYTLTRTPRRGEAYLPIPIEYARRFDIFNSNHTNGRDILGQNIFNCTSKDGYLKAELKAQGARKKGEIYAKQFSVNNDLKAIGDWYRHIGAQPGDTIEVYWETDTDIIIQLL